MPYKKKLNDIALSNTNDFFNRIKSEVTSLIKLSEFEFYELELFAVTDVLLDEEKLPKRRGVTDYKYYVAIQGNWVNDSSKKTLPKGEQWVLPLDPHIKK